MTTRPKILLDSGAFTGFQRGVTIDLPAYIAYVKQNQHLIEHCINLDQIPGSEGRREWRPEHFERGAVASYENQQRMKDAGLRPIPVVRKDDDPKWLERYIADGEPYIALASHDKGFSPIPWLDECFAKLKDEHGQLRVKVHGLAFTSPLILLRYPWTSVDSSTWSKEAAHGQIPVPLFRDGKPDFNRRHQIFVVSDRLRLSAVPFRP